MRSGGGIPRLADPYPPKKGKNVNTCDLILSIDAVDLLVFSLFSTGAVAGLLVAAALFLLEKAPGTIGFATRAITAQGWGLILCVVSSVWLVLFIALVTVGVPLVFAKGAAAVVFHVNVLQGACL